MMKILICFKEKLAALTPDPEKRPYSLLCFRSILTVFLVILAVVSPFNCGLAEKFEKHSPLLTILSAYGKGSKQVNSELDKHYQTFTPLSIEKNNVEVSEILFDGLWVYTTVHLLSGEDSGICLIPGGVSPTDDAGTDSEGEAVSWLEKAKMEGRKLQAAYCYPKEFDHQGVYFLDYLTGADGDLYLIAGCKIPGESAEITMNTEIYEIDPDTLRYHPVSKNEASPVVIAPLIPVVRYLYRSENPDVHFEKVEVIQTGVTTYVDIHWNPDTTPQDVEWILLDADKNPFQHGYALEAGAYLMDTIPEKMFIQFPEEGNRCIQICRENNSPLAK